MNIQIHVNFGPTTNFEATSNIRFTSTHAKLQIHAENVLTTRPTQLMNPSNKRSLADSLTHLFPIPPFSTPENMGKP